MTPSVLYVTNEVGRRFQVRAIRKGTRYGLNGCLLHDEDDPVVEFSDVTSTADPTLAAGGPFVARYPARAFLADDEDTELWLYGKDVAWRLGADQLRQVRDWVRAGCPG